MKSGPDKKLTAWDVDLRVRERNLASGALDPKALERYLAELPDVDGHADSLPFEQPALGRSGGDGQ